MGATITSKGQITIPIDVRRALGLRPGMRVAFVPTSAGTYELVPESGTVRALKGAIATPAKPVSLEQMDAAIEAGIVEDSAG